MKRVMIIGSSGSGKSTLARQVGAILNLPIIHIDPMFFTEGWVQRPREETHDLVNQAAMGGAWVFEGNCSRAFRLRAERADLIVMLDLPRLLRIWRVLWRTASNYGKTRPDMAPGCPERFDWEFLKWVWNYPTNQRPEAEALAQQWQDKKPFIRLNSRKDMAQFLVELASVHASR